MYIQDMYLARGVWRVVCAACEYESTTVPFVEDSTGTLPITETTATA